MCGQQALGHGFGASKPGHCEANKTCEQTHFIRANCQQRLSWWETFRPLRPTVPETEERGIIQFA